MVNESRTGERSPLNPRATLIAHKLSLGVACVRRERIDGRRVDGRGRRGPRRATAPSTCRSSFARSRAANGGSSSRPARPSRWRSPRWSCFLRATPASPRFCWKTRKATTPGRTRRAPSRPRRSTRKRCRARPRRSPRRIWRARRSPSSISSTDRNSIRPPRPIRCRSPCPLLGLGGSAAARSGEARVVDVFLSRLTAFPVAKTRVLQIEFVERGSGARGARRQRRRAAVSRSAGDRQAGRGQSGQRLARRQDRRIARQGRRGGRQGRELPGAIGIARRRQQHDRSGPATGRPQRADGDRALDAIGGARQGAARCARCCATAGCRTCPNSPRTNRCVATPSSASR